MSASPKHSGPDQTDAVAALIDAADDDIESHGLVQPHEVAAALTRLELEWQDEMPLPKVRRDR